MKYGEKIIKAAGRVFEKFAIEHSTELATIGYVYIQVCEKPDHKDWSMITHETVGAVLMNSGSSECRALYPDKINEIRDQAHKKISELLLDNHSEGTVTTYTHVIAVGGMPDHLRVEFMEKVVNAVSVGIPT